MKTSVVKIGPCTLDTVTMLLSRNEHSCKLSVKVFQLLKLFLTANEHIVSREEAIETIWLGNEGVGKRGYTNAIWTLRKAFKELGVEDQEIFITLPKVGYQLALTVIEHETDTPAQNTSKVKVSKPRSTVLYIAITAILTGLISLLIWYFIDNAATDNQTSPVVTPLSKQQASPESVTNYEGIEEYPTVSNNGQYVAFLWHREHFNGGIYIKDLSKDSTPLNLISMTASQESSPAWSYDDQSLAYIRSTNDGKCEIRVRKLLSNSDELIDENCLYKPFTQVLSWSKGDNSKLVYSKLLNSGVSLFVHNFSNKTTEQLTYAKPGEIDFAPVWSDDNEQILFIRQSAAQSFNVILQDKDLNQKIVLKDKVSIIDLDWDTKANKIYVNYSEHGKFKIVEKSLSNNNEVTLLSQGLPSNISLNTKSKKLLYSDHISKEYIALINYKTGRVVQRISSSSRDMYGRYNKNNGHILFISNRSGNWSVWVNNKVTSKNLSNQYASTTVPSISPDGRFLAVNLSKSETGSRKLFLIDLQTSKFNELNTDGLFTDNISWSNDNKSIYFFSRKKGHSGIFKLDIATEEVKQLTFEGEHYAVEGENGLLYASITNKRGIWAIDVEAKSTTLLTPDLAEYDYGSFFLENGHIYYLNRLPDEDQVKRISMNEEAEVIQRFPANSIRKFYGISKANEESFIATLKMSNEADISAISIN